MDFVNLILQQVLRSQLDLILTLSPNTSSVMQTSLLLAFVTTWCRECGPAFADELLLRA